MENLEIEHKYRLRLLPFHNADERLDIIQRYGHGIRIRKTKKEDGVIYHQTEKTKLRPGVWREIENEITEEEYNNLVEITDRAISKVRLVYYRKDGLKWEVDLYRGLDLITAEIELPSEDYEYEVDDYIQKVMLDDITDKDGFSNYELAFEYIDHIDQLKAGQKVYFIPDGMIYDYGYQGQTGKTIIYKEGERNMQDSYAVDAFNLSLK